MVGVSLGNSKSPARKSLQKFSRKDFLKAVGVTGALGVLGSLMGVRMAQGHELYACER